ncbi:MAG: hypothetical protein WD872_01305 [Pirellulaceae bacterium]
MTLVAVVSCLLLAAPPITALAIAPDGSHCLAASQAGVLVLALPDLERQATLETALPHVHHLAFSPRGERLAIAGGSPAEAGSVEIWNWPMRQRERTLAAGDDVAYRASWNGDGSRLAVAGGDKTIRLLSPAGGDAPSIYECHSAAALCVIWLPQDAVISGGADQAIRVLDSQSGKVVRSLDNHTAAVRDLAVRPGTDDGLALVASCSADRTVRFWQPAIGRLVRFARLASPPTALAWTPSGSHVLAACEDGRLRAVDPVTIAVVELPGGLSGWAYAVAILPGGKSAILGGQQGELRIVPLDAINR